MSFLFDKKTKNAMRGVWIVASVMIILSMVLVFSGGSQGAFAPPPTPQQQTESTAPENAIQAEDLIINAETADGEEAELEVTPIPVSEIEGSSEPQAEFEASI